MAAVYNAGGGGSCRRRRPREPDGTDGAPPPPPPPAVGLPAGGKRKLDSFCRAPSEKAVIAVAHEDAGTASSATRSTSAGLRVASALAARAVFAEVTIFACVIDRSSTSAWAGGLTNLNDLGCSRSRLTRRATPADCASFPAVMTASGDSAPRCAAKPERSASGCSKSGHGEPSYAHSDRRAACSSRTLPLRWYGAAHS